MRLYPCAIWSPPVTKSLEFLFLWVDNAQNVCQEWASSFPKAKQQHIKGLKMAVFFPLQAFFQNQCHKNVYFFTTYMCGLFLGITLGQCLRRNFWQRCHQDKSAGCWEGHLIHEGSWVALSLSTLHRRQTCRGGLAFVTHIWDWVTKWDKRDIWQNKTSSQYRNNTKLLFIIPFIYKWNLSFYVFGILKGATVHECVRCNAVQFYGTKHNLSHEGHNCISDTQWVSLKRHKCKPRANIRIRFWGIRKKQKAALTTVHTRPFLIYHSGGYHGNSAPQLLDTARLRFGNILKQRTTHQSGRCWFFPNKKIFRRFKCSMMFRRKFGGEMTGACTGWNVLSCCEVKLTCF